MLSMAATSIFCRFAAIASQILPTTCCLMCLDGARGDAVDPELIQKPRRWDMKFIRRFMVQFILSPVRCSTS